jgi:hypothetical protein
LRAEYSARPKPETPCSASECSSWPTAKTARGGYEIDPKTGKKVLTLEGAACSWPDSLGHERSRPAWRRSSGPAHDGINVDGAAGSRCHATRGGIGRTRTGAAHVWHGVPRLGRHRAR